MTDDHIDEGNEDMTLRILFFFPPYVHYNHGIRFFFLFMDNRSEGGSLQRGWGVERKATQTNKRRRGSVGYNNIVTQMGVWMVLATEAGTSINSDL